ncbi:MAG: hypothetical protein ACKVOK_03460 [Flavobacteriales bacterium]
MAALLVLGCNFNSEKKPLKTFYNTISDWDIRYIPIVEPFKASSIDHGVTWNLETTEILSSIALSSFGVTQNCIYGKGDEKWFFYDTRSGLYATYTTKEALFGCLESFELSINEINLCNSYFDSLEKGKSLYWYPEIGEKYPVYANLKTADVETITLSENATHVPGFRVDKQIASHSNKIYFFEVVSTLKNNELYYFSFNNSSPILPIDGQIIPVFAEENRIEIVLYTPYPIAQERGIPEDKRVHKQILVDLN